MEILPVANQFNVGFNNDKAWNNPQWREAPLPASTETTEASLAARLERELRAAKSASALAGASVLVPGELLSRAARHALQLAAGEPCGARGAALIVDVEGRRLAAFRLDPGTLPTHEIHLHLLRDDTDWTNLLPQFLKNLTRGGTIIISPQFTIEKKKLFRGQPE